MKNILDTILVIFFKLIFFLLQLLPTKVSIKLLQIFFNIFFSIFKKFKKTAYTNFRLCLKNHPAETHNKLFQDFIFHLSANLTLFLRFKSFTPEYLNQISNLQETIAHLQSLSNQNPGKAILVLSMHYGLFECLLPTKALLFRKGNGVARSFGLKKLDNLWNSYRSLHGTKIISRAGAFKDIISSLQHGEDISMLADQNVKANHAVFIDFFGLKASAAKSFALAALRTDSPIAIVTAKAVKEGINHSSIKDGIDQSRDLRLHFTFHHIDTTTDQHLDNDQRVQLITQKIYNIFEQIILSDPAPWFWVHRRFKTRPNGEPENLYT